MIFEFFSKRQKKIASAGLADVYQYDAVPTELRIQIQQILLDAIGPQFDVHSYSVHAPRHNAKTWKDIHKILCRELGRHRLTENRYSLDAEGVLGYIGTCSADEFVDALELCCRVIEHVIVPLGEYERQNHGIEQDPRSALEEINYRLRESSFGFSYENGEILRQDSSYTHEEIVKPALRLLAGKNFEGAQDEFLKAHRHYRTGENEQAVVWAAKAFESALKGVCKTKKWHYEDGARAADLLKVVRSQGLWPEYLDGSFDQLLATLASGLPKVRNDAGAHGQGPTPKPTPAYIAGYAIQLCAAKIRLMAEAAA